MDMESFEHDMLMDDQLSYDTSAKLTDRTYVITPNYDITYEAKVFYDSKITYTKAKPLDIIKINCLDNLTSYDGQREAIYQTFNYKQKVPIPLLLENIIMIPSKAPKDMDCHWLNYDKIVKLNKDGSGTQIIFDNDLSLTIPESYRTIRQQYKRAQAIKHYIQEKRKQTVLFF